MFEVVAPPVEGFDLPTDDWTDWPPGEVPAILLEALPAGAGLAMELQHGPPGATAEPAAGHLDRASAFGRVIAWAQANMSRELAGFERTRSEDPGAARYAADEVTAQLRITVGRATGQLVRAGALDTHLRATRE